MKKVLITGVSTGIGYSSAKILCDSGYFVYGSVRKNEDGERLSLELGDNFQPLIFDVTDSKAISESVEKVQSDLKPNECLAGQRQSAKNKRGGILDITMGKVSFAD